MTAFGLAAFILFCIATALGTMAVVYRMEIQDIDEFPKRHPDSERVLKHDRSITRNTMIRFMASSLFCFACSVACFVIWLLPS